MFNYLKTYSLQLLIGILLLQFSTLGVFYFQKNSLKKELKTQKDAVLELKTKIILLKKNSKIELVNAVNTADSNKTKQEIKKLEEIEHEIVKTNDHVDSNNILGGLFIMQSTD